MGIHVSVAALGNSLYCWFCFRVFPFYLKKYTKSIVKIMKCRLKMKTITNKRGIFLAGRLNLAFPLSGLGHYYKWNALFGQLGHIFLISSTVLNKFGNIHHTVCFYLHVFLVQVPYLWIISSLLPKTNNSIATFLLQVWNSNSRSSSFHAGLHYQCSLAK